MKRAARVGHHLARQIVFMGIAIVLIALALELGQAVADLASV